MGRTFPSLSAGMLEAQEHSVPAVLTNASSSLSAVLEPTQSSLNSVVPKGSLFEVKTSISLTWSPSGFSASQGDFPCDGRLHWAPVSMMVTREDIYSELLSGLCSTCKCWLFYPCFFLLLILYVLPGSPNTMVWPNPVHWDGFQWSVNLYYQHSPPSELLTCLYNWPNGHLSVIVLHTCQTHWSKTELSYPSTCQLFFPP